MSVVRSFPRAHESILDLKNVIGINLWKEYCKTEINITYLNAYKMSIVTNQL